MKEYNGFKNYNYWNQSVWINNDETLYYLAIDCINKVNNTKKATQLFFDTLGSICTNDGIVWTKAGIYNTLITLKKEG
jgi:hypothetical protein